jgi:hypothetical protein
MERELISTKKGHPNLNPLGLIEALDLMELGFELKKQSILRACPSLSPERLMEELQKWISSRSDEVSSNGDK